MDTTAIGNRLEDDLYQYLCEQKIRGDLILGTYPHCRTEIYKKRKYPCKEREDDVEFDIVLEITRQDASEPHLYVILECKNWSSPNPETVVTDFSDKLSRIAKHNSKGILVTSSRLQKGAEKIARNRGIAIVKYDRDGLDFIAERSGGIVLKKDELVGQFYLQDNKERALRFSGYFDDCYYSSIIDLLHVLAGGQKFQHGNSPTVRSMHRQELDAIAELQRRNIEYVDGPVELDLLCSTLGIELNSHEPTAKLSTGNERLGWADFREKKIHIVKGGHEVRERFTIAHEIGHFVLGHGEIIRSDAVLMEDLLHVSSSSKTSALNRLEAQANLFAAELLLPRKQFTTQIEYLRKVHDIHDRGHGYIYVDDQPCNYAPYHELLGTVKTHFGVSKQAIEIRLLQFGMLADSRRAQRTANIMYS